MGAQVGGGEGREGREEERRGGERKGGREGGKDSIVSLTTVGHT